MKRLERSILLLCLIVGTSPMVSAADSFKILYRDLDRIFSDRRFEDAQWGVEVFSLDRSETIYRKNSRRLYIPASNQKILTAAVALMRLGPDYRFKTHIYADGQIAGGALAGNLIVIGFGDPSSSSRIPPKDPFLAFRSWAVKFKQIGIQAITGAIIGDGGSFDETAYGRGWAWDDLPEGYAAPASALQFNENRIDLEISPSTKEGAGASINMSPLADYLAVDSRIATEAGQKPPHIEIERSRSADSVAVRGALPLNGAAVNRTLAVQFPTRYYLSALKHVLQEEGIDVSNCEIKETRRYRPQSSSPLWIHDSPPLSDILAPLLKLSLNLASETLVRTLGLELRGEGTFSKGKEVVEETLGEMGIDKASYSYADGSGLSRMNLVSADTLVHVLAAMYKHRRFSCFYDALPAAGSAGTLENRMKGTKAENNAHAKTGTLTNISALSGYVRTSDGEMLAFSILANNFLAPKEVAEALQDKAVTRLANFSRKSRKK